jgi:hypothetical protein
MKKILLIMATVLSLGVNTYANGTTLIVRVFDDLNKTTEQWNVSVDDATYSVWLGDKFYETELLEELIWAIEYYCQYERHKEFYDSMKSEPNKNKGDK